jgi:hypothetical protein
MWLDYFFLTKKIIFSCGKYVLFYKKKIYNLDYKLDWVKQVVFILIKQKKTIIDRSNFKKEVIKITWEVFFQKKTNDVSQFTIH